MRVLFETRSAMLQAQRFELCFPTKSKNQQCHSESVGLFALEVSAAVGSTIINSSGPGSIPSSGHLGNTSLTFFERKMAQEWFTTILMGPVVMHVRTAHPEG